MTEAREAGIHAANRLPNQGTQTVEREDPPRASEALQASGALEVHLSGGDPLVYGLPVFVSSALVLGFALIGMVPVPSSLGSVLPATTLATGLGEFVTAL